MGLDVVDHRGRHELPPLAMTLTEGTRGELVLPDALPACCLVALPVLLRFGTAPISGDSGGGRGHHGQIKAPCAITGISRQTPSSTAVVLGQGLRSDALVGGYAPALGRLGMDQAPVVLAHETSSVAPVL